MFCCVGNVLFLPILSMGKNGGVFILRQLKVKYFVLSIFVNFNGIISNQNNIFRFYCSFSYDLAWKSNYLQHICSKYKYV